jgi:hypothetical protein
MSSNGVKIPIPKCGGCFEVILMEYIGIPFPTLDKGLV